MNSIKKVLSFILLISIMFSSVGTIAFNVYAEDDVIDNSLTAEEEDEKDPDVFLRPTPTPLPSLSPTKNSEATLFSKTAQKALTLLNALEIINLSQSSLDPNAKVSLAEFTKAIDKMFSTTQISSEMIDADQFISMSEAIKFLLNYAGYKEIVESSNGFSSNNNFAYLSKATQLGILSDISNKDNSFVSMNDMLTILYNTLNVSYLERDSYSDGGSYNIVGAKTVMEVFYNLTKVQGVIDGTFYTNFYGVSNIQKNEISINKIIYKMSNKLALGEINTIIGKKSTFYVKKDIDDGTQSIICLFPHETNVLEIQGSSITENTTKSKIYYTDNSERTKSVGLNADLKVIYNTQFVPSKDILDSDFHFNIDPITNVKTGGKITLISSEDSTNYDIAIIEKYIICYISTTDDNTITDQYATFVKPDAMGLHQVIYKFGDAATVSDRFIISNGVTLTELKYLSNGSTANIGISKDGNHGIVYAVTRYLDKEITEMGTTHDGDYFIIDNKKYLTSYYFDKYIGPTKKIKMNTKYHVVFDVDNRVVSVEDPYDLNVNDESYALLTGITKKGLGHSTVKLYTITGTMRDYVLNDDFKINGKKVDDPYTYLTEKYPFEYQNGTLVSPNGYLEEHRLSTVDFRSKSEDRFHKYLYKLIKYKLNDKGELIGIDLPKVTTTLNTSVTTNTGPIYFDVGYDPEFSLDYALITPLQNSVIPKKVTTPNPSWSGVKLDSKLFYETNNTNIFVVPADKNAFNEYFVLTQNALNSSYEANHYDLVVYDANEYGAFNIAVAYLRDDPDLVKDQTMIRGYTTLSNDLNRFMDGKYDIANGAYPAIVKGIVKTPDGYKLKIMGYDSIAVTYVEQLLNCDDFIKNVDKQPLPSYSGAFKDWLDANNIKAGLYGYDNVEFTDLKKGDIILYGYKDLLGYKNVVDKFVVVARLDDLKSGYMGTTDVKNAKMNAYNNYGVLPNAPNQIGTLHMISTVTRFKYRTIELEGIAANPLALRPGVFEPSRRVTLNFMSLSDANIYNSYSLFKMDPNTGDIVKCGWQEINVGDRMYVNTSSFNLRMGILIK